MNASGWKWAKTDRGLTSSVSKMSPGPGEYNLMQKAQIS